jgi:predicted metal-binding protein
MTNAAIIRCEKNAETCPLTSCLNCLTLKKEGFVSYDECSPAGIFTCRCPGDNLIKLAKILKAKGTDVIHFCTCMFSKKTDNGWIVSDDCFCESIDTLIEQVHTATKLPCVKGTAHLPQGYRPEVWGQL